MRYTGKNNRGFTLIELLIVVLIISFIGLAVYSVFSQGIAIWERTSQNRIEEEVNIFMDGFSRDLKNVLSFQGIDFRGDKGSLEFPGLCYNRQLKTMAPGRISYYYQDGRVIREARDISQVYEDEPGPLKEALREVRSLEFRYYLYDAQKKEYSWEEESPAGQFPLAIRLELQLDGSLGVAKAVRTVSIPIGG